MFLQIFLLGMIGTPEIVLLVLAALLLFGGKKIPELMRGLGSGVKSFKEGMKEGSVDPEKTTTPNEAEKKQGEA